MFKWGQLINNIHTFHCPHCNEWVETLRNPSTLTVSNAKCPYCKEWIMYDYEKLEVKKSGKLDCFGNIK